MTTCTLDSTGHSLIDFLGIFYLILSMSFLSFIEQMRDLVEE